MRTTIMSVPTIRLPVLAPGKLPGVPMEQNIVSGRSKPGRVSEIPVWDVQTVYRLMVQKHTEIMADICSGTYEEELSPAISSSTIR